MLLVLSQMVDVIRDHKIAGKHSALLTGHLIMTVNVFHIAPNPFFLLLKLVSHSTF